MLETLPEARGYHSILEILEDAARRRPEVVAMALAGDAGLTDEWSATEVLRRSRLAAWRLHAMGLSPGDRLLIWCPSGPELAALTFGAMRIGVAIVPLDLRMAPEVIERIAGRAETGFLAIGTGRDAPDPREVQLPDVVIRTVPSLVAEPESDGEPPFPADWEARVDAWPRPSEATLFEVIYTSGTTGLPKGVMLTHGTILSTLEADRPRSYRARQHRTVSLLPLVPSVRPGADAVLRAVDRGRHPLHPLAQAAGHLRGLREHRVTTMVVVPQLLELFWTAIEREVRNRARRSSSSAPASIARRLPYWAAPAAVPPASSPVWAASSKLFVSAAAYLPPALQQAWEDIGVVVAAGLRRDRVRASRCGQSDHDHPTGHGRHGHVRRWRCASPTTTNEILVRGPTCSRATGGTPRRPPTALDRRRLVPHGRHRPFQDERGDLVLSGRTKNIIVLPNGLNVFPEDIENVLRAVGLAQAVVLETAPGRIEAVVLSPDAPPHVTSTRRHRSLATGARGGRRACANGSTRLVKAANARLASTSASTAGGSGPSPTSRAPTRSRSSGRWWRPGSPPTRPVASRWVRRPPRTPRPTDRKACLRAWQGYLSTGISEPTVETRSKAPLAASGSPDCDAENQLMITVESSRPT